MFTRALYDRRNWLPTALAISLLAASATSFADHRDRDRVSFSITYGDYYSPYTIHYGKHYRGKHYRDKHYRHHKRHYRHYHDRYCGHYKKHRRHDRDFHRHHYRHHWKDDRKRYVTPRYRGDRDHDRHERRRHRDHH